MAVKKLTNLVSYTSAVLLVGVSVGVAVGAGVAAAEAEGVRLVVAQNDEERNLHEVIQHELLPVVRAVLHEYTGYNNHCQ